jgi:MFS family permease
MVLASTLMGLAAGGMLPVWGAMVAAAFGVASYGRVMGLIMPVISVFSFPGPVLAATSIDETGSYQMAMRGFVLAIAVAALLLLPLRLEAGSPSAEGP